jgi:glycosyltransferase involved in cell wall biosynthesis
MKWAVAAEQEQVQRFREALQRQQEETSQDAVRLRQEIAEVGAAMENLQHRLASADDEIERAKRDLLTREQVLKAQSNRLQELESNLGRALAQSAALSGELAARTSEREALQRESAALSGELAARTSEREALQRELDRANNDIIGLLASRSFRLTRPLRAVGRAWRRQRQRLRAVLEVGPRTRANQKSPRHVSEASSVLLHSGLFDEEFYLAQCPELRGAGISPAEHYLAIGAARGLDPHPLFDSSWYLAQYSDVAHAGANPLVHYLAHGSREGRNPHPLFDASWYLAQYPDVAHAGTNPLVHYLAHGWREGRNPHPLFDSSWYLAQHPDVAHAGANPLVHYLAHGWREGRDPHPLFSTAWYAQDLARCAEADPAVALAVALTAPGAPPRRRKQATPRTGRDTVYAFTSVCLNYVPKARVLARTLKQHNPDIRFCLLINEPVPEWAIPDLDPFDEVAEIDDLEIAERTRWIFTHTMVELCTGTKGFYMHELLQRPDCRAAFFFDPDIAVFSSIDPLLTELQRASILLTPHQTEPETSLDAIVDNEICSLQHGVFNLGFLGLKPSPEGLRFVRWWRDRLENFCRADIPNGLFTDQRWVDLAPAFFQEIAVIRHPGCNVATWNLTHRRVEGDFKSGFTVNCEPLVFYHFSGFDSGAQEIMLNKYGGRMLAAQRLRRWYVAETERAQDRRLTSYPWAYGFFRNSEPITDEHRRLYRQRPDLQQAYPNPFDVPSNGSYLAWYTSEVLERRHERGPRIDGGPGRSNPMIDYLVTWRRRGTTPNPYFDPTFYLERNPDVGETDPLIHYVVAGAREQRDPSPEFDTAFYRTQVPDLGLTNPLVHYLTVGQAMGLRTNARFDPGIDARPLRALEDWSEGRAPVILMASHYGGGGTEKHVRELAALLQERARVLLITPTFRKTIVLTPLHPSADVRLEFDPLAQKEVLVDLLRKLGVCRLHIHHAHGNEHFLAELVAALGLPFDFTVHDYYTLAPNPQLVGDDGRFVGEDLWRHHDALLRNSIAKPSPATLAAWQAAHEWLLLDADRVIAPSGDVARRLARHVPGVEPVVAAHPEKHGPALPQIHRVAAGRGLRIALLGQLWIHKGLRIVLECARLNRLRTEPFKLNLFGEAPEEDELRRLGVAVTGRYREEELPELLRADPPDVLWYPAQWPETYCYALSAGLSSGLPLVVPDLGAFPERVAGRPWAWVRPWNLEPEEWLNFFEHIQNANFIPGACVTAPGTPPAKSDFYPEDYLAPAIASRHDAIETRGVGTMGCLTPGQQTTCGARSTSRSSSSSPT